MSAPAFPETSSCTAKASDSAIDDYASKVLKRSSPPDAVVDSSLGPYVTSLLRCADISDIKDLSSLEEYESLLELLEDQCNMEATTATNALETIAEAVVTKMLPLSEIASGNGMSNRTVKLGLYTGGDSSLDSFQSMREQLPGVGSNTLPSMSIDPYTPSSAGGPSPLKPDNLIPEDLLGALDNPSPNHHRVVTNLQGGGLRPGMYTSSQPQSRGTRPQVFQFHSTPPRPPGSHRPMHSQGHISQHHLSSSSPPQTTTVSSPYMINSQQQIIAYPQTPHTESGEEFPPLDQATAFPPLGASTEKSKRSKSTGGIKKTAGAGGGGNQKSAGTPQQQKLSDKELAAVLFRPARPRQNSIETEQDSASNSAIHLQQRSRGSSIGSYHATQPQQYENEASTSTPSADAVNDYFFQQQLSSCVEILLSMNQELSEEAATEAALMAHSDFNVAQYIFDAAMTAPPICRHMLQEGCYRSDCQFSHDVDGHTCLFWIRGRCGKGSTCKFLHGFNDKLLDGISFDTMATNAAPLSSTTYGGYNSGYSSSYQTAATSFTTVDSAYTAPAATSASWPLPTLADSSASNSYSSGETASVSFANIASKGYDKNKFSDASFPTPSYSTQSSDTPTVRIPQDLWNPHENRDASVFHIADPLERYHRVAATVERSDVIDLHFQSTKTFSTVLATILPTKLGEMQEVWIVTGTGHHVGSKTHQKGGGALERAVAQWLTEEGYNYLQGKDRNGLGGALLVKV
ncbi:Smr domain containing protein [Nitzschia inconspicua]|uniref:Smr domain containing protein n=1 Tax=Nitzschia inconspicua TaxID=303405 RepID=A0A9K3LQ83_9STRA|nr:Smr domain containing protein [Nitzschia inconspicua]